MTRQTSDCTHPQEDRIGLFPSTTGGTERCLLCCKERTQYTKNGPWRPWRRRRMSVTMKTAAALKRFLEALESANG